MSNIQATEISKTSTIGDDFSIILHSPDNMNYYLTASVLLEKDATAFLVYNGEQTPVKLLTANVAQDFTMERLARRDVNKYQLFYSFDGGTTVLHSEEFEFSFPSKNNDEYSFCVGNLNSLAEEQTNNKLFYVDLGGHFAVGNNVDTYKDAMSTMLNYRKKISNVSSESQVFITEGNNDGELSSNDIRVKRWAKDTKDNLFPCSSETNYQSVEYGEALVVILDAFSYSNTKEDNDSWTRTLGETQYDWLKDVLRDSNAENKFICIGNLCNTQNSTNDYEWGCKNKDDFKLMRKGWKMPIHDLLLKYEVKTVFYSSAKQSESKQVDGINYIGLAPEEVMSVDVNQKTFIIK